MAKVLYQNIIGIAVLGLLLAACGAPSGNVDGNPDSGESFDGGDGSDVGKFFLESNIGEGLNNAESKEEPKDWQEEHDSCGVQELSGYLYEFTPTSPYASAEITIKDYEGEQLEAGWDEPPAFRFAGEADVTWRFYHSLAEMDAALNEAVMQEMDGNTLHFLYYTFSMTENDHALDLYNNLKRRFDTEEHPLTAWGVEDRKSVV